MDFEDYVDDLYFSVLIDQDEIFPISDALFAEELQFQEGIMASVLLMSYRTTHQSRLNITTPSFPKVLQERVLTKSTIASSSSSSSKDTSSSFCEICMEEKQWENMFATNICSHAYCKDCISKHVAAKIQENITPIICPAPNCGGVLEPHVCQSIIPTQVFERWCKVLCESTLIGNGRVIYCPFKDCQTPLMEDEDEYVMESECPSCRRLFCAQCQVPWHAGIGCDEFQSLNGNERAKEDVMMVALFNKMKWKRCPFCKFFVERTEGCPHMTCRCSKQFCYNCGKEWHPGHETCVGR